MCFSAWILSLSLYLFISFIEMRYKSLSVVVADVVRTHCKCEIYSWHQFGGTQCVILSQTRKHYSLQLPPTAADTAATAAMEASKYAFTSAAAISCYPLVLSWNIIVSSWVYRLMIASSSKFEWGNNPVLKHTHTHLFFLWNMQAV